MRLYLQKIKKSFLKYLAFWLVLALLLTFALTKKGYAQSLFDRPTPYTDYFTVSAYYSPLPNQSRYVTGSYDGDIRLNGDGVLSADNSLVYAGMIAAPAGFPFGTKINIEGIGIGEVHDRGGAIKGKRLDVWMGYGEEGMSRALAWGIRNVQATVYGLDPDVKQQIDLSKLPLAQNVGLFARTKYFRHDLGLGDESDEISELQRLLKELGYLQFEPTGVYAEDTEVAVLKFQLDKKVIDDALDSGAGLFGPRTRQTFESALEEKQKGMNEKIPKQSLETGDKGDDVARLQDSLVTLGYLNEKNGVYDKKTFDAVLKFQKANNIILRENEFGAGHFGSQTKAVLKKLMMRKFTPDASKLEIPERYRQALQGSKLVFNNVLKKGDKGEEVERLQEELRRLNYLRIDPTGFFGAVTEHAVFKFQQRMGIVDDMKDSGAGLVGPRTRETLQTLIAGRETQNRLIAETTEKKILVAKTVEKEKPLIASVGKSAIVEKPLSYGERGEDIKKLQELLKTLGYFSGYVTSDYFGDVTRASLIDFQKAHGLIKSGDEQYAGVYEEKTRNTLMKLLEG